MCSVSRETPALMCEGGRACAASRCGPFHLKDGSRREFARPVLVGTNPTRVLLHTIHPNTSMGWCDDATNGCAPPPRTAFGDVRSPAQMVASAVDIVFHVKRSAALAHSPACSARTTAGRSRSSDTRDRITTQSRARPAPIATSPKPTGHRHHSCARRRSIQAGQQSDAPAARRWHRSEERAETSVVRGPVLGTLITCRGYLLPDGHARIPNRALSSQSPTSMRLQRKAAMLDTNVSAKQGMRGSGEGTHLARGRRTVTGRLADRHQCSR
ncbi:hypothetical protein J2X85_001195 [Microbacterium trichothecenolyticum]|nr:hypothetical protein [Microbacterium trichothecenolyticum]